MKDIYFACDTPSYTDPDRPRRHSSLSDAVMFLSSRCSTAFEREEWSCEWWGQCLLGVPLAIHGRFAEFLFYIKVALRVGSSVDLAQSSGILPRSGAMQYRLTDTGAVFFEKGTGGGVLWWCSKKISLFTKVKFTLISMYTSISFMSYSTHESADVNISWRQNLITFFYRHSPPKNVYRFLNVLVACREIIVVIYTL